MIDNIKACIKNNYKTINGTKVKDYHGFSIESWNNQLKSLMNSFNIKTNKLIIKELTLCIFSLFQELIFVDDSNNKIGKLVMLGNQISNELFLCTSEIDNDFSMVCFTKQNNIIIMQEFLEIVKYAPSEVIREDGVLKMKNIKGTVCEVN